jgi:apolipoprotein N-acyltransferase
LVVAPETAVPLLPGQLAVAAPGWWDALRAHFEAADRVALVGVPLGSFREGYTNSARALGPVEVADYRYDKLHLVPFGEFIPLGFRWFTDLMRIPLGDFARGSADPPSLAFAGQRLAPNICYEDLFGEELARRFRDPSRAPTMIVNMSNIAWFGDTVAVPQHLGISRMRSLELQRPMLRATNTGATAVIDHRGRVAALLPAFERGALDATVEGRQGLTPYAWWASRFGLWPLFALALAVVLWRVWRARASGPAAGSAQP